MLPNFNSFKNLSKHKLGTNFRSTFILLLILLVTVGLYGFLLYKDTVPLTGFALLLVLWIVYWILSGRLYHLLPMDIPILILLCLLPLSLSISVDWSLSLPKIYGLILGVLIFYLLVNLVKSQVFLHLSILALVLMAVVLALLGLIGMPWSSSHFSFLSILISKAPVLSSLTAGEFIHPNTIGGALAFFLPLLVALLWDGGAFRTSFLLKQRNSQGIAIVYKLFIILSILIALLTLYLSRSRGAWLGSALGLLCLAFFKNRRFLWLIPVIILVGILIFFARFNGSPIELLAFFDAGEDATLQGRLTSWQYAVAIIQDFPLTGVGIGTFGKIVKELYTYDLFAYSTQIAYQPHNTFLAVAVDLGIPGLIAYISILTLFFLMVSKTLKQVSPLPKMLLFGLASGIIAHQVFGLMDAFLLGTKLSVIMWIFLGLAIAMFVHREQFCVSNPVSPSLPLINTQLAKD